MRAPLLSEASHPTWGAMEIGCKAVTRWPEVTAERSRRGLAVTRGLSLGQEETLIVSKVYPNCAGAPRQESSPMLSRVSQCVPALRNPWGGEHRVLSLETCLVWP